MANWSSEWAKKVGGMIREDRKNAGFKVREFAEVIGISPTYLTRMEKGERPLDSTKTLVRICKACHVPIEKYLAMFGMEYSGRDTPIRRAFPTITTEQEEEAIAFFANLITLSNLAPDNITQILNVATAYAEFCEKQNEGESK